MSIGGAADFSVQGSIVLSLKETGLEAATRSLQGMQAQAEKTGDSLKKAGDSLKAFGQSTTALGQKMSLGVTAPLIGLGALAVNAASDLAEASSAVSTVFGAASKDVLAFSETTETALGLSQAAALSAATELGALFTGVGLGQDAAADFSKSILSASADLASFYNVAGGSEQVLQDIRSGLIGEAEPLRKYGILLSEAAVQQELAAKGQDSLTGSQLEAAKVSARYAIIMRSMGAAQGDFARTSGGLANQLRIAKALFADAAADLGTELLPVVLRSVKVVVRLIRAFAALPASLKSALLILAGIAAALGPVLIVFGSIASALGALAPLFGVLLAPIALVIAAMVALGVAYKTNFLGFADAVGAVAGAIMRVLQPAVRVIRLFVEGFRKLGGAQSERVHKILNRLPAPIAKLLILFGRFRQAITVFSRAWKEAGALAAFKTIPRSLELIGRTLGNLFASLGLGRFGDAIKTVFADLGTVFTDVVDLVDDVVHGRWSEAWDDFLTFAADAGRLVFAALSGVPALLRDIFDAIPWTEIGTTLLTGLTDVVASIPWDSVWSGVSEVADGLWTTISDAVAGLDWDAIWDSAIEDVKTAAAEAIDLGTVVVQAVAGLSGDLAELRDDFAGWFQRALDWTDEKTVQVPKLILQGDVSFTGTQDGGAGFGAQLTRILTGIFQDWPRQFGALLGREGSDLALDLLEGIGRGLVNHWQTVAAVLGAVVVGIIAAVFGAPVLGALLLAAGALIVEQFAVGVLKNINWARIGNFFLESGRGWVGLFKLIGGWLYNEGRGLVSWLWTGIASLATWLWNQVWNFIYSNVLSPVGSFTGWLYNAGRDIVSGIWNGIASLGGWLYDAVKNFVSNNILNPVKKKLHMDSPSKVMAGYGRDITRGLAIGMLDMLPMLAAATDHLSTTVMTAAPTMPASSRLAPPPMAPTSRTVQAGGVVINVSGAGDPATVADHVYRALDAAFGRLELEVRR